MSKTTFAHGQLRSIINRIIRLKDEQEALSSDIKEVYAEAKASGFDKTVIGLAVTRLRKEAKDPSGVDETDSMLDVYLSAYRGDDVDGEGNDTEETADTPQRAGNGRETASKAKSLTRVHATHEIPEGSPAAGADAGPGGVGIADPGPVDPPHDPVTGEVIEIRFGSTVADLASASETLRRHM